jgi:hypothetical protein
MTKGVGVKIGESLGEVENVDVAGDGVGWGRCVRIRVIIDLVKPLEHGRALELEGKSHWVNFKYENLPLFCYQCSRVVHEKMICPVRPKQRFNAEEGEKEWGPWLRAELPRKKKIMNSGGEGVFHSLAVDHEAGGGFRQGRYDENDKSGFSGNPNNSYGNFHNEGREDSASWIKDRRKISNS